MATTAEQATTPGAAGSSARSHVPAPGQDRALSRDRVHPGGDGDATVQPTCPRCGRANPPSLRLCAKCGTPLGASTRTDTTARPPAPPRTWWQRFSARFTDPQESAARRAYRRSLPRLVRWRRRALAALLVILVGGSVAALRSNPVDTASRWWHELRGDLVPVPGLTVTVEPPATGDDDAAAAAAIDGSAETAWTTPWTRSTATGECGRSGGAAMLHLRMPPAQVRQVRIVTGLTDPSRRPLAQLPATMFVATEGGDCVELTTTPEATEQVFNVDFGAPVTDLFIGVASVYPPTDDRANLPAGQTVSVSEVSLWQRPGEA